MGKLFKLQFRRLFKSKSFYILIAISLIAVLISLAALKAVSSMDTGSIKIETTPGFTALKGGFGNGLLSIILAITTAIFISEDFSSETIKNIYAKGYSHKDVFVVDYFTTLIETAIILTCNMLFSFLVGTMMFGVGNAGENYFFSLIGIFFIAFAYHSIFFAISISLRKPGGSIAFGILGPLVINLIINLVDAILGDKNKFRLSNYWIDGKLSLLTDTNVEIGEIFASIGISLLVMLVCLAISYFVNDKRE